MSFDSFKKLKDMGIRGENTGIPFSLPKLIKYVPNIQKSRINLIGALSGAGKTKFLNNEFIFNAYDETILDPKLKLRIVYWSLELSAAFTITALIVRWLHKHKQVLVDSDHVLSMGKSNISKEVNDLIER